MDRRWRCGPNRINGGGRRRPSVFHRAILSRALLGLSGVLSGVLSGFLSGIFRLGMFGLIGFGFIISGCAVSDGIRRPGSLDDENVTLQRYDYSCGAAALATLMTYHFNDPVSEDELLGDILAHIPEKMIKIRQKEGVSLLDLKKAALRRGYRAYGVKLKKNSFLKLSFPVLVYLETERFRHFAALKGAKGNRVFLADPDRGNIQMAMDEFMKMWKDQIALILFKSGRDFEKENRFMDSDGPLTPLGKNRSLGKTSPLEKTKPLQKPSP